MPERIGSELGDPAGREAGRRLPTATNSSMNCVLLCVALRAKFSGTVGPQFALLHECPREARKGADGSGRALYYSGHQVFGIPTSDRVLTEFEQFEPQL